jgi:hypothetical protein
LLGWGPELNPRFSGTSFDGLLLLKANRSFYKKIEILFIQKPNVKPAATSKMNYVLNALDVLVEYPELMAYIKDFAGPRGFMFTESPYEKQLDALLDSNGTHSGGSWACMLRGVQAVLNGVLTRADVVAKLAEEERKMAEWKAARKAAAAQQAEGSVVGV